MDNNSSLKVTVPPPDCERGVFSCEDWLRGLKHNTARNYQYYALPLLPFLAGREPYPSLVTAYLERWESSPGVYNLALAAVRSLSSYLFSIHMWAEDYVGQARLRPKPYEACLKGNGFLTATHVASIFEACTDVRHRAILAVMFGTGARRAEVAALQLSDFFHLPGTYFLTLRKTKTGRPIRVAIPTWAGKLVETYISERGEAEGSLFSITGSGVYFIFKHYVTAIGLPEATPHWVRATVVVALRELGKSNREIREVTGHRTDAMIERYDKRKNGIKEQASLALPSPLRQP